ncbi:MULTISPECIES: hypothetical protein [Winogradskyella]|uniref:hypothetical protein n=1 Tax=Winogradskyella TaxID=286104 RepID=UPI0015CC29DB|nr:MULTISPECIES: hypothetical protein [Winogradskyella]QXP79170.1 hypothetical protein H0I32_00520 [Winogradskyella sp. HaHa_3_26]
MEKNEFLEQHIFTGLENINDGYESEATHYFSELDFATVLERAAHFGLGIYSVEARLDGEVFGTSGHDKAKKKATDPKWYTQALSDFKKRQAGLAYGATYKVSQKLLDRKSDSE